MAVLSISIDLTGSTLAKQALVEASVDDRCHRRDLYADYLKLLFEIERDFYRLLIDDPSVDLARLFLVKTIGDELWYAYEVDAEDEAALRSAAWGICGALMKMFCSDRYLAFDMRPVPGNRRSDKVVRPRVFNLPVKACIDLVDEAIEVNVERYEYLKDIVATLSGHSVAVYAIDEPYLETCNRLNLGSAKTLGTHVGLATRSDFIGLQVDRFFRLAKFCVPLLLGVGDNLMRCLPHSIEPVAAEFEHLPLKVIRIGRPETQESKYVIQQTIAARDMRGVGEDYALHHVFGEHSLGDALYASPPAVETLLEPTRAFLAAHGFYALQRADLIS